MMGGRTEKRLEGEKLITYQEMKVSEVTKEDLENLKQALLEEIERINQDLLIFNK